MSNRLESLNGKKAPAGAKPSLKFKPKVVARKSKEERAKEAPVQVKQEAPPSVAGRGRGSLRGRGRGGRNNYAGTHLVSSGPLSSGSVSMGNANGSKLGLTTDQTFNSISPTPEFLQNLKLKERTKSPTPGYESENEEEEDHTKINMNEDYRFADEETVLFPVRPERVESEKTDAPAVVKSESPELVESESATVSREPTVKSEPIEEKLEVIKQHKAELESKITEPTDLFDREESNKLISDHQEILDLLTDKLGELSTESAAPSDKYIAFHLPKVLPTYSNQSGVKDEPAEKSSSSFKSNFVADIPQLKGQIGHANIHQSGKITINLGNDNNLALAKGNPSSFLQEVVMVEMNEAQDGEDVEMMDEEGRKVRGKVIRLGEVEEKLVATPVIH